MCSKCGENSSGDYFIIMTKSSKEKELCANCMNDRLRPSVVGYYTIVRCWI